jgi:hypothetical protein
MVHFLSRTLLTLLLGCYIVALLSVILVIDIGTGLYTMAVQVTAKE